MSAKKERTLTEAEQRRLDAFSATCDRLAEQGYVRTDLNIGLVKANIVAIVVVIALFAICLPIFYTLNPDSWSAMSIVDFVIILIAYLALIVVHELIHGLTWSFFTKNGFKDIEFGIMRDTLTPYCTCAEPLRKSAYVIGALTPLIILGILPTLLSFAIGSFAMLFVGIIMIASAMGDVLIVLKVLRHKQTSDDVLLYDHPTEAGSVIFERAAAGDAEKLYGALADDDSFARPEQWGTEPIQPLNLE